VSPGRALASTRARGYPAPCTRYPAPAEALGLGYVPHSRATLCSAPHTHDAGRARVLVLALTSHPRAIPACATLSGWVTLAAPCSRNYERIRLSTWTGDNSKYGHECPLHRSVRIHKICLYHGPGDLAALDGDLFRRTASTPLDLSASCSHCRGSLCAAGKLRPPDCRRAPCLQIALTPPSACQDRGAQVAARKCLSSPGQIRQRDKCEASTGVLLCAVAPARRVKSYPAFKPILLIAYSFAHSRTPSGCPTV
jgi:hypothetical protein